MKKNNTTTYSLDEIKAEMETYLELSAQRLRARLRSQWKKQVPLKTQKHDRFAI